MKSNHDDSTFLYDNYTSTKKHCWYGVCPILCFNPYLTPQSPLPCIVDNHFNIFSTITFCFILFCSTCQSDTYTNVSRLIDPALDPSCVIVTPNLLSALCDLPEPLSPHAQPTPPIIRQVRGQIHTIALVTHSLWSIGHPQSYIPRGWNQKYFLIFPFQNRTPVLFIPFLCGTG